MSRSRSTEILKKAREGDSAAAARLLELVYNELRALAAGYLRRYRRRQSLQATDVVHEAYLKLVGQEDVEWQDKTHFVSVAACAMRQVLVDHARKRSSRKRGGGWQRVPLRDTLGLSGKPELDMLCLDEALQKLQRLHGRQARVVELRFFGDLKYDEIAETLGVSARTVESDWYAARAWLHREMGNE